MAKLYGYEAGNGGYKQAKPKPDISCSLLYLAR